MFDVLRWRQRCLCSSVLGRDGSSLAAAAAAAAGACAADLAASAGAAMMMRMLLPSLQVEAEAGVGGRTKRRLMRRGWDGVGSDWESDPCVW